MKYTLQNKLDLNMKYIFLIVACLLPTLVHSQSILDWKAQTSFRSIIGIEQDDDDKLWLSTNGGIAVYEDTVLVKSLTIIDGLSRLSGTSIEYDPNSNSIFVGYIDGIIDIIDVDNYQVTRVEDINRNTVFTSKQINKLLAYDELLYVGTDFGIVEYDISSLLVRNSYIKLGSFDSGTGINDIELIGNDMYVATEQGIAYSSLDGNYSESAWENYNESSGLEEESIQTLGFFNNNLVASSISKNYKFENNSWSANNLFTNNIILDYSFDESKSIALSERNIFIEEGLTVSSQFLSGKIATALSASLSNRVIIGTLNNGIGEVNDDNSNINFVIPKGPYQNFFQGMSFDNGILISSSSQKSSGNGNIDRAKGYYIYDGNTWTNINAYTSNEINTKRYQQAFTSLVTDQFYYFGSWGRGISRFNKETEEVEVFDETNTTIRGWSGAALDYPVMIGLEEDSNGDIWTVSRFAEVPLYRQSPGDDDWQPFSSSNAISGSDLYEGLFIDSFDLKWIPLQNRSANGTGLLIIDTNDPLEESDDVAVKLEAGASSGNLPDNKVKAIVQDKNDEVWIGTERGIAKFIFPELIVDGSVQERTAQWLINEDTTALSRFLLRDINVSSMAVNAANQKWIGSTNQGIWVLNEAGSKILKRFTAENSPLFSNNIISIAINDVTGEVYIATDVGLISYQDVPKKAVSEMKDLKVFPNPFNYKKNEQIFIEGLSDESSIKILGVDGTVVNTFDTKGGRFSWDGHDTNGQELGSGVYFIVAVDEEGSSKGVGKVIIVR
jgi:hypothetical protein